MDDVELLLPLSLTSTVRYRADKYSGCKWSGCAEKALRHLAARKESEVDLEQCIEIIDDADLHEVSHLVGS